MATCYRCGAEYPYIAGLCPPCQAAEQLVKQTDEMRRQTDAMQYQNHSEQSATISDDRIAELIAKIKQEDFDRQLSEAICLQKILVKNAQAAAQAAALVAERAEFNQKNNENASKGLGGFFTTVEQQECINCDYIGPMGIITQTKSWFFKRNIIQCPRCDVKMLQDKLT